ncbi:hypothetical protein VTG60DRAFT_6184 [Thermothelomyces hinnuleus]
MVTRNQVKKEPGHPIYISDSKKPTPKHAYDSIHHHCCQCEQQYTPVFVICRFESGPYEIFRFIPEVIAYFNRKVVPREGICHGAWQ